MTKQTKTILLVGGLGAAGLVGFVWWRKKQAEKAEQEAVLLRAQQEQRIAQARTSPTTVVRRH